MNKIDITDNYQKQDNFRKEFISLLEKYKIEIEDFYIVDPLTDEEPDSDIRFQGENIDISLNDLLTFYLKHR
jgi:hypothetical protein